MRLIRPRGPWAIGRFLLSLRIPLADPGCMSRDADTEERVGTRYSTSIPALLRGENVLGELVDKGWIPSRSSPLADIAPVLVDYCAVDELRWEGLARLTANLHSYNQQSGDFRAQLGDPRKVSRALQVWAQEHRDSTYRLPAGE